jgi:hypothetical protein
MCLASAISQKESSPVCLVQRCHLQTLFNPNTVFTSVLNGLYRFCPYMDFIAFCLYFCPYMDFIAFCLYFCPQRTLSLMSSTDFHRSYLQRTTFAPVLKRTFITFYLYLCPTRDFTASVLNGLLLLMSNTGLYRFCPQRTFTAYVQTQDFYRFCPYTGLYCFLSLFLSIMDLLDNTCQFRPPVDLFFHIQSDHLYIPSIIIIT